MNVPSFLRTRKKKNNSRLCSLPLMIITIAILIMIISTLTMNKMALSADSKEVTNKWISLLRQVAFDTLYVYDNVPSEESIDNPPINWSIDYDDEFDDINQKENIDTNKEKKHNDNNNDNVNKKKNEKLSERNDYHEIAAAHPQYSPRDGTDINIDNKYMILGCIHQSKCIVPMLELQVKLKIYLCLNSANHGIRFYFLVKEGLAMHPNVEIVDQKDINNADFILYLPGSAPWHKTECTDKAYINRLIVMDEFDGHPLYHPYPTNTEMTKEYGPDMKWYYMFFKRSFTAHRNGKFLDYPHLNKLDVYPISYAISETYTQDIFSFDRDIEIVSTLRGHKAESSRLRVQNWVTEYTQDRQVKNSITSAINKGSRGVVSQLYFEHMQNAKIVVTVNPANWEGDFRLWEALATGALVFVDPLYVPLQFPLLDKKHLIYYDNNNKTELWEKLDYYRKNKEIAKEIAIEGYLHAMKYHRTVNMIDYVLKSAHYKRDLMDKNLKKIDIPYQYTAFDLRKEAVQFENNKMRDELKDGTI
jgi:hypothetical protein